MRRTNINGRNSCEEFHARFAAVSHFSRFVAPEKVTLARAPPAVAVMGEGGRSEDADVSLASLHARAAVLWMLKSRLLSSYLNDEN